MKNIFDIFAGTERLASAIGNGGLADVGQPIVDGDVLADKLRERDTLLFRVMAPYPLRINRNRLDTLYAMTQPDTLAELIYFFHSDHLGSASWITDLSGQPVQHLQYKPFGGDYIDQQDPNTDYSERFRFTGKERDAETGYDYFGARSSEFAIRKQQVSAFAMRKKHVSSLFFRKNTIFATEKNILP